MVKTAGEAVLDIMAELVNQIMIEGVIRIEWELRTSGNWCKGKCDSLQRENYRRLILTGQLLKIAERINQKLTRQQVDNDDVQLGFRPDYGNWHAIFIWRQLQKKYLAKQKNFSSAFLDLDIAFDWVTRWALKKVGAEECLVKIVHSLYRNVWSQLEPTEISLMICRSRED